MLNHCVRISQKFLFEPLCIVGRKYESVAGDFTSARRDWRDREAPSRLDARLASVKLDSILSIDLPNVGTIFTHGGTARAGQKYAAHTKPRSARS